MKMKGSRALLIRAGEIAFQFLTIVALLPAVSFESLLHCLSVCNVLGYNICMTQISRDDVLHLAQLSSLQLAEDEVDDLAADITKILGYVEQLDELDTEGVEPTYQVTGLENVWREDVVSGEDVDREALLALAPESQDSQVRVPKVL